MATPMAIEKSKAPKLDVDEFLTLAISETPQELHAFFESFQSLYSRKYVYQDIGTTFYMANHCVLQTMASIDDQAIRVLRSSAYEAIPRRCLQQVCERLRVEAEPA